MFRTISMRQLEHLLNQTRDFLLLDVREPEEYRRGCLEGAVNLPLEQIQEAAEVISRDRPVVVYCAHGNKSLLASRELDRMGYDTVNAAGGLQYYRGNHLVRPDSG